MKLICEKIGIILLIEVKYRVYFTNIYCISKEKGNPRVTSSVVCFFDLAFLLYERHEAG